MAESDYSFLLFDELAHPLSSSSIVNAKGYVLHVSKTLLYIHEPTWLDDYGEPMDGNRIATVREGWVEINGFYIEAKRWSPESIFFYITFVAKEKWGSDSF